jgi:hypothetical protein
VAILIYEYLSYTVQYLVFSKSGWQIFITSYNPGISPTKFVLEYLCFCLNLSRILYQWISQPYDFRYTWVDLADRPPEDTNIAEEGKGFSLYNTGLYSTLSLIYLYWIRQTREGGYSHCRMLKLRQMETQRVLMKGILPRLVCWARHAGTRDFVLPWLLYSAQYKYFFPHHHAVFHFIGPSSSKLGRQSCCITCLLICVSVLNVYC